jgi:aspartyl aminopeptidase
VTSQVEQFLRFITASPSPYHAIQQARQLLNHRGFQELQEADIWPCVAGGAYYVVRDGKSIIAWRQGMTSPVEAGFRIAAAHSDSPALKLRPNTGSHDRAGRWLKPDVYGSALVHTWLDRDLRPTGVVLHRADDGSIVRTLVDLDDLILRAVSLAPHLKADKKSTQLAIDVEKDLLLLFAAEGDPQAVLRERLAAAARIKADAIIGHDLFLADVHPAATTGAKNELISAPRLDNLFSSWCALVELADLPSEGETTRVAAIFDAEEIGSTTWAGARSTLLGAVLDRIVARTSDGDPEAIHRSRARSILASLDMAHAEHPAYAGTIDPDHVPLINGGIAMKGGSRGNYAIAPHAAAAFEDACRAAGVPLQRFMYRCDHGGGSSVGPLLTSLFGIAGFDLGAPLLAMHSIREVAGTLDLDHCRRAVSIFYRS